VYAHQNVDVHAAFRLTLNVIAQNLAVTLSTTLSETLTRPASHKSNMNIFRA